MENEKHLNAIFDINKYSFNSYSDVFLREGEIDCCDNEIEILLKTNAFNFYIKWLEEMIKGNYITSNYNKSTKEQLIIETYYFMIDKSNYLYYYEFDEIDECSEIILLLNSNGNFIATGHNGGHLFIRTDKFSFCNSDGTGDQLFYKKNNINNKVLLEKSLDLINYCISIYTNSSDDENSDDENN